MRRSLKLVGLLILLSAGVCLAGRRKPKIPEFHLPHHPNIGGLLPAVVRYGESFDPLKGVLAYDWKDGYLKDIRVSGQVDTHKPGTTTLTYSVRNSRGDTKTVQRSVTVLPPGKFAVVQASARRGPRRFVKLDESQQNKLLDGVTLIQLVVHAVPGTEYRFKLIERCWDEPGYRTSPPTAAEWKAAPTQTFYRDLYLCMRPRLDRWLKIIVRLDGRVQSWTYGLKGDPGVRFYSEYLKKDIWRLSRPVDDPMTAREQFPIYSQFCSYWCPLPLWLEKQMGGRAHVTTIGDLAKAYEVASKEELHGFYTTIRAFMRGVDKRSQSDENWKKIAVQWDHALGQAMNASFRRSFQIPIAEMNGGNAADFLRHFSEYYRHVRQTFNPERIIVGTALRGHASVFAKFYDAGSPYFKAEWHKGHFPTMFQRFAAEDKKLPFIIMYPRINEVWSKDAAFRLFETHRKIHLFAQMHRVEAAILDKIGILGRTKDGKWSSFALPYYALWFCYRGYDYLNNGPFFADDWDGDGLSNQQEHELGTNPFHPDSDGDLIFDGLEVANGLDPRDPTDAAKDFDHDRMSNYAEIVASTFTPGAVAGTSAHPPLAIRTADGRLKVVSPLNPEDAQWDPDGDLLPAWFEVNTGLDPCRVAMQKTGFKSFVERPDVARQFAGMIANFAYHYNIDKDVTDFDGDGVTNLAELTAGTDPTSATKQTDARRKQWAQLGRSLFQKYFQPERFRRLLDKRESHVDAVFAYSPTEHGLTAEISIRSLRCDAFAPKASPEKIECLTARLLLLLEELRRHPELWTDQQKIIAGVSVRTYLNRPKTPAFRQDRGLYTIYIPRNVFRSSNFSRTFINALKELSAKTAGGGKRKKSKSTLQHVLLTTDSGIKILFCNSLDKDCPGAFRKARNVFLGQRFDFTMFQKEYTASRARRL